MFGPVTRGRGGRGVAVAGWASTVLLSIVAPILTYHVLTAHGMGQVWALLLSGVWPAAQMLGSALVRRHADEFAIFTLILLVIGVVTALVFEDPRVLFVKDSAVTGLFGIMLLGSLLFGRPLMFYLGRRFATDGSRAGIDHWNALWRYPQFRRVHRVLTVVWGAAFLAEAVARAILAFVLPTAATQAINSIGPYIVLAALLGFTSIYSRRRRADARAHGVDTTGDATSTTTP